jgi:hypothetical protein
MIRLLLAPGSAAAANGMTADVDVLLDAGAAGSAGDDFTVNTTIDAGAATGAVVSPGLDQVVALSISSDTVTAGAVLNGYDETITTSLITNGAPAVGLSSSVSLALSAGSAEGGVVLPSIGDAFGGGFYGGLYSATQDGNATHALVVAPKSTATKLDWWATQSAANALAEGGFTDWVVPNEFELAILYMNLKPTTNPNNTSTGINNFSVPPRTTNYTADDPSRTSVASYQDPGGSQFFKSDFHWTSSGSSNGRWCITFSTGQRADLNLTQAKDGRFIRRVALP